MLALRHLQEDDWESFRSVRLAALTEAPYAFGSTVADWSGANDTEDRWRGRLTAVPFNVIASENDLPVGMVSGTSPQEDRVELISMWVAPHARGRGIGAKLITAVVDWAQNQEANEVALDVMASNTRAISLYGRHGFVDVGWTTDGRGPSPERHMVRVLRTRFV
jgi:ribosomal protein S18 acetylase RimI-like enzyme